MEKLGIGEDGHGTRAAVEVAFGLASGIEIGIDGAGGGGGFFDLGDDSELVGAAVEGGAEASEIVAKKSGGAEFFGGGDEGFDFLFFEGNDFVEFVHACGEEIRDVAKKESVQF